MNGQFSYRRLQPLGEILQEAGLISEAQLKVALEDQKQYPHLRLGEILVWRGWVKQETVNFFAQQWDKLLRSRQRKYPLGYYLREAALLDNGQIEAIIQEQRQLGIRFGAAAVLKGLIGQRTLNFFLKYLAPEAQSASAFVGKRSRPYAASSSKSWRSQRAKRRSLEEDSDLAQPSRDKMRWIG